MAEEKNQKLASLGAAESRLTSRLAESPSARSGEQAPSMSDIRAQQRLLQTQAKVEEIKNKQLRERWYGKDDKAIDEGGGDVGLVGKTLDILGRPLRAVVGGVDYATGRSGASSLSQAVVENITKSKRTFGDVLKDTGAPGVVSAPLGFMLDVAFDPVNWVTAGSTALVPRIGLGLVRGTAKGGIAQGLKAMGAGAESRALETTLIARNAGRLLTGAPKVAAETGRLGGLSKFLEGRAVKSAQSYDELTGRDFLKNIESAGTIPIGGIDSRYRVKFGDLVREGVSRVPFIQPYFKYFDYNNAEWTRIARIKDSLMKTIGSADDMKAAVKAYVKAREDDIPFEEAFQAAREEMRTNMATRKAAVTVTPEIFDDVDHIGGTRGVADNVAPAHSDQLDAVSTRLRDSALPLMKDASDAVDIMKDPKKFSSMDHMENALRLASEDSRGYVSLDDLKDVIGRGEFGETGVKWYDDLKQSIRNFKYEVRLGNRQVDIGKKMGQALNAYEAYISFFKRGKVGASPTAWMNAVLGNPTMAWMTGVNIMDPLYMKRIKDMANIVRGARSSDLLLRDFLRSSNIMRTLDEHPTLFKNTSGFSADYLRSRYAIEHTYRVGMDEGLIDESMDAAELGKAVGHAIEEVKDAVSTLTHDIPEGQQIVGNIVAKIPKQKTPRPSQVVRELWKSGKPISEVDMPTGQAAEFFDAKLANEAYDYIRKRAEEGNKVFQLLNLTFNRASEAYEGVDQTFKLGTVAYATIDGFTESELTKIARFIDIKKGDLTEVVNGGVRRYQLAGSKALELANEIYLNYAAMPAAVKVLRNLPLVGSPFASFMYGMGLKTVKTLAYNPAVFNKVAFGLNDFGGTKSPLEKGVLSDPRYAYLNAPGMFKVPGIVSSPFFETNTLYLNLANILPYYSFNMFTPPERRYSELYTKDVINLIDKSPFIKDPVGSVIFDYLIQPMVLQKDRPLGSFGQPLYPTDATALEKTGYFARSMVDPIIPGFWSPVGGLAQGYLAPGATEVMPSYRWRQVANALQGKTNIGATGKEPPVSRTLRSLLGSAGVSVQTPVPLSYLPPNLEKQLKKQKE